MIRLIAAIVLLAGCGASSSGGLAITLRLDPLVSEAERASIGQFAFQAGGDESGQFVVTLTRAAEREERVMYRPLAATRSLSVDVRALTIAGVAVATGSTGALALPADHAASADVLLAPIGPGPTDGGVVDGAVADLAVKPWMLIQHAGVSSTGALGLDPTGAKNTIIVATENTPDVASVSDDAFGGSSSYEPIPGTRTNRGELWYTKSSRAGATQITVTLADGGAPGSIVAWEVAGLDPTLAVEDVAVVNDQPPTPAPQGAGVTSSAGAFVISALIVDANLNGIYAGNEFTNDETINANGWAHLTSPGAPAGVHRARWNGSSAGSSSGSTASFAVAP